MAQKTPFDFMRASFAPKGSAQVTNITRNLESNFFDSDVVLAAVDSAELRLKNIAVLGDFATPLSPLEVFALQFLMRASGQSEASPSEGD